MYSHVISGHVTAKNEKLNVAANFSLRGFRLMYHDVSFQKMCPNMPKSLLVILCHSQCSVKENLRHNANQCSMEIHGAEC